MSAADILADAAADLDSLTVVHYPDPRLRAETLAVESVDDNVRAVADRMFDIMFASQGVGLAAPQVGLSLKLLVASPTFEESDRLVLINPTIVAEAGWEDGEEGCLSFPNIYGDVERPVTVMLKTRLLNGEMVQTACGGLLGRCLQHELDHLDGVVFVNRMKEADRAEIEGSLKKLKKQTRKRLKA